MFAYPWTIISIRTLDWVFAGYPEDNNLNDTKMIDDKNKKEETRKLPILGILL